MAPLVERGHTLIELGGTKVNASVSAGIASTDINYATLKLLEFHY